MMRGVLYVLLLSSAVLAVQEFPSLDHIRPSASPEEQREAARDLIIRVLGADAKYFNINTISSSIGTQDKDTFIVKSDGELVDIAASSGVAAAMGVYYFIKTKCNCQYTWAGSQLTLPHPLPVIPNPGIQVTTNDRFRYYQNVCTSSYSFAWWNWTRWEREIDWMAMNGINLPLAFTGQEAIFQRVYMSMGFTKDDLKTHWGGPAFLAWSRMGNMHGWGGPLPQSWIDDQLAMQHKILARMRSLGMTPVLPGFAGHVPMTIKKYYPNVNVSRLSDWGPFNNTYCCTYLLDFEDPLFQPIGTNFIKEMQKEFGVDHVYNADSFNEMEPGSGDVNYLKKAGSLVYKAMTSADPYAIWLMQGWLFQDQKFWLPSRVQALLTSVPLGKMIVLDLSTERVPVYSRTKSFYGQPFIWCMLHDYGGILELFGEMHNINVGPFQGRKFPNSTMIGTGLTPEGINQNEAVYEFMNENAIAPAPRNLTQRFIDFSVSRYGEYNVLSATAWLYLLKSVYNSKVNLVDIFTNEVIIRRPTLTRSEQVWYDPMDLFNALEHLVYYCDIHCTGLLKYDMVDVLRNNQQLLVYATYQSIVKAYKDKDLATLQKEGYYLLDVLQSMGDALASDRHFLLGTWIADSRQHGHTPEEKDLMEYNARNQVTLWGPRGEVSDYAGKQWAGLVQDYYTPRWEMFISFLTDALHKGVDFNQTLFNKVLFDTVEQPFTFAHQSYPTEEVGNSLAIAWKFLKVHGPEIKKRFPSLKSTLNQDLDPSPPQGNSWIHLPIPPQQRHRATTHYNL